MDIIAQLDHEDKVKVEKIKDGFESIRPNSPTAHKPHWMASKD